MSTLKATLSSMLLSARAQTGRPVVRTLPRGLVIEIVQAPSGELTLSLQRRDTAPSAMEWKTVLAHWPEPADGDVVPIARRDGRRHALVGRWARPALLVETDTTRGA